MMRAAVPLLLLIWYIVPILTGTPPFILPGPDRVLQALWTHHRLLADHLLITIIEILAGLFLASILGWCSAILLASSRTACRFFQPLFLFSQIIPFFALAPILTLWLGYGLSSKIAMTVIIIYFPITSTLFDALIKTPEGWLELAHTMGASRMQILYRIRIPNALPGFASGLRLAAVYAPMGAIIGEWVGASHGLGYLMLLANGQAQTDLMFATVIILAALTLSLHTVVTIISRRFLDHIKD
ncbi:MAG: ABC transporter permease [Alphaproteobacteria bacterium]|nr:ABC transporter permease [Alphaproteobacteria bacterium]